MGSAGSRPALALGAWSAIAAQHNKGRALALRLHGTSVMTPGIICPILRKNRAFFTLYVYNLREVLGIRQLFSNQAESRQAKSPHSL
jgi:hypothetical protein